MAKFFIERPIFAWVIALFIMVAGAVSITQLPIAQYPPVAPPSIIINATYPGASAKTLEDSVLSVIEQEMNGSPGLIYMEAVAQANGTGSITLSFEPGTNADLAQVDVQNRLARATPRLPAAVTQQGVRVDKSRNNFLLFAILTSDDPALDPVALGDYASRSVVPEIQRLPGVGQAQLFGTERAMRIWIDPAKLLGFNLSAADVTNAIRAQNAQVSAGEIGALPNVAGQSISATVVVNGQLASVEQFGNIVLRASSDGATVRLKDVARIELGAQGYATSARLNGKPSTGIGVQLAPSGNALATAEAVRARMTELEKFFPEGMSWTIPYDSSKFVKISIQEVAKTLAEAVALVFLVMLLFLQNWRYTLIPTVVVPVALLGTFAALLTMGFSINVLTMFGMVLVIGIVVDDAIVVVENVEQGHGPDLGRHHRRDRGADLGVRAAGLLQWLGGQHLPPVRGGDGRVHRLLGLHGAVAHARLVRHAAQTGRGRAPPREEGLLRLVQPHLLSHRQALRGRRVAPAAARGPHHADLCRHRGGRGTGLPAPARFLPAQ
jgi:multidrug efflux pump